MEVSLNVESCRQCPHSTNNAIEHNDLFTSTPRHIYWWCKKTVEWGSYKTFQNERIIQEWCPYKEKVNG